MTGKVLGQFFTPPLLKKMMVKLIDPQIHPDGKIDTCGDPTMGTGGFLITYLHHILQQATNKNITPDWEFIKTEGLYGKEKEPDTYQLAVSNMLISSGHMFDHLDRGDSIREPITRKFDNILANPPFGIKGLKYDDFYNPLKSEYTPIKSDNAVSLFLQAIIYMLKINGKGAVVLPDGQDLFSKTNMSLVAIREYLMKTCDLKEIIYLPSGIFEYTSIKTCVFYFVKKREGTEVLETKIKTSSKTQKETGRDYKFSKTHQTTQVKFYEYNLYTDIKTLLAEVPIEKIASNSYSLNYTEYMNDDTTETDDVDNEGVVVKTLGEVCNFKNGKGIKKVSLVGGEYPVIGGGKKPIGFHNEYNTKENTILCSSSGSAGYISKYATKVWASDCFAIIPKDTSTIDNNYVYYFLKMTQQDNIYKLQTGSAQPHVYSKDLQNLRIPIPPLEKQREIVKYLKDNDAHIKQLETEIEEKKKQAQQYMMAFVNPSGEPVEEEEELKKKEEEEELKEEEFIEKKESSKKEQEEDQEDLNKEPPKEELVVEKKESGKRKLEEDVDKEEEEDQEVEEEPKKVFTIIIPSGKPKMVRKKAKKQTTVVEEGVV
jgi:hypothetical protein